MGMESAYINKIAKGVELAFLGPRAGPKLSPASKRAPGLADL